MICALNLFWYKLILKGVYRVITGSQKMADVDEKTQWKEMGQKHKDRETTSLEEPLIGHNGVLKEGLNIEDGEIRFYDDDVEQV